MPTLRLLWIAPWALWSCTDKGSPPGPTADPDVPPTASITAPLEGGPWYSDHPVALAGTVADAEDAPDALDVRWATAEGGDLGVESTVSVTGAVTAQATLPEGDWTLLLEVTDSAATPPPTACHPVGGPNQPPDCALTAPADVTTVEVGAEVVAGTATDADVGGDRLSVTCSLILEGELQTSPDVDGAVGFTTSDPPRAPPDQPAGGRRGGRHLRADRGPTVGTPPTLAPTRPQMASASTRALAPSRAPSPTPRTPPRPCRSPGRAASTACSAASAATQRARSRCRWTICSPAPTI